MSATVHFVSLLGARCVRDKERLRRYEVPERGRSGHASCVLLPESEEEVASILEAANASGQKLVISAGRTGLVEAQRPEGEAVLSLERLSRILAIDRQHRRATVQAGVSIDALNAELAPLGLMFPLEMGSSSAATIGACVANGSAGANAVCYGTAAHLCDAAWGFWGRGTAAGPDAAKAWSAPPRDGLAIDSARIRPHWGLVGSQGVFGVITRARVRLHPIPSQREAALIPAGSMPAAMDILAAAHAEFGLDVEEFEFISREALALVRALKGDAFRLPFERDPDSRFYLLLQVKAAEGDLPARLYDFLARELALPDDRIGYAPLKALKEIRHSITEGSNLRMRSRGGGRLAFDTATPTAAFGDYLDELETEIRAAAPQVELIAFGHAGVGGAHLHLLGDASQPVDADAARLTRLVFDVTQEFGGTFSAEHGVGAKWSDEFLRRTPPEALQELVAVKRARDPSNVLNPRCLGFDKLMALSSRKG